MQVYHLKVSFFQCATEVLIKYLTKHAKFTNCLNWLDAHGGLECAPRNVTTGRDGSDGSRRARSSTRRSFSSAPNSRPYPDLHSTVVVPVRDILCGVALRYDKDYISGSLNGEKLRSKATRRRTWRRSTSERYSVSSSASRVARVVNPMPPPAWAISWYVAPASYWHDSVVSKYV